MLYALIPVGLIVGYLAWAFVSVALMPPLPEEKPPGEFRDT